MTDQDPDPITTPEATAAAQAALDAVAAEWLGRRGVVAVEVARRRRDGVPTGEVGIRVTVEEVLAPEDVPEGELFPDDLDGIPVDVVEGAAPTLE